METVFMKASMNVSDYSQGNLTQIVKDSYKSLKITFSKVNAQMSLELSKTHAVKPFLFSIFGKVKSYRSNNTLITLESYKTTNTIEIIALERINFLQCLTKTIFKTEVS